MEHVFGETCLISQIKSFFACLGMSALRTLPDINCACKQVRMIASIDERPVPSCLTSVRYLQIANERICIYVSIR